MSAFEIELRWCATCQAEVLFEQPDCGEGHGGDCPEWVCAQCGDALVLGFPVDAAARQRARKIA